MVENIIKQIQVHQYYQPINEYLNFILKFEIEKT